MTALDNIKQVHFVGIGGYGMSALAFILLARGYRVSGSDLRDSNLTRKLAEKGAVIRQGHDRANLGSADLVIYSTAIDGANPELSAAREKGLLLWHRSEMLAALLNSSFGIAIAGAHGKTTTTAMTALLLEAGGLDPTALVGGVVPAYGSNARLGASPYLVAEADESDRSFIRYFPRLALVTGIEADHLEHYGNDYNKLRQAYSEFLSHLPTDGTAVLCADDPGLRRLGEELDGKVIWYSLYPEAATALRGATLYRAANLRLGPASSTFDLFRGEELIASSIKIGAPGRHNVANATGALTCAAALDLDPAAVATTLARFHGVGRRFELVGEVEGIGVIDDYAHHPTEIRATLQAARLANRRVLCLFQPHRYSRTAALFEQFAAACAEAFGPEDLLFLHAVYPAGEKPIEGATSAALAGRIRELAPELDVHHSDSMDELEKEIINLAYPGDRIITMGAGDVTHAAPRIVEGLRQKFGGSVL